MPESNPTLLAQVDAVLARADELQLVAANQWRELDSFGYSLAIGLAGSSRPTITQREVDALNRRLESRRATWMK